MKHAEEACKQLEERGPQHRKARGAYDVRNEILKAAMQLTNHFLYSHIHTHQEKPRWAACVTSGQNPTSFPAQLIRQVATVRVLDMVQWRRHSSASGT